MRLRRKASAREIVQTGDPVLREVAEPVDPEWIGTPECEHLIEEMVVTMREAPGVGLAGPQIGLPLQVFVVEDRPENLDGLDEEERERRKREAVDLQVFFNPVLEHVDQAPEVFYEGCLSVDGFAAIVARSNTVRVRALGRDGKPFEVEWSGWPARILQHEYDHLQGTLYIDRMDTRTFARVDILNAED